MSSDSSQVTAPAGQPVPAGITPSHSSPTDSRTTSAGDSGNTATHPAGNDQQTSSSSPYISGTGVTTINRSSRHTTDTGAIAGGVAGGLVALFLLLVALMWWRVRRRIRAHERGDTVRVKRARGEKVDLRSEAEGDSMLGTDPERALGGPFDAMDVSPYINHVSPFPPPDNTSLMAVHLLNTPNTTPVPSDHRPGSSSGSVTKSSSKHGRNDKALLKAQERQQELARMVAEHEESLALLQQRSPPSSANHAESAAAPTPMSSAEEELRSQIRQMQEEMHRMQAQLSTLNDEPPPRYE